MKKVISSFIAALAALSFAAVASAIPANSDMNKAINVLENQDEGSQPAKKPAPPKKVQKQKKTKVKKKAPASSGSQATPPAPEGK